MISRELHYLYRKQVRSSHSQHRLRSLAPVSTTTTRHSTTTTQTKTMSHRIGASLGLEPGSYQEAIYDIYVGTVVGAAHIFYFVKRWIIDWVIEPLLWVVGKNKKWKTGTSTDESGSNIDNVQQPDTDKGELKVVGIGFGRTGTVRREISKAIFAIVFLHGALHFQVIRNMRCQRGASRFLFDFIHEESGMNIVYVETVGMVFIVLHFCRLAIYARAQ